MCGIAGYAFVNGPAPETSVLKAMGHEMIHRGPDGEGIFVDGQVGLVHRRLSIIDLKTGENPIYNEDRSVCTILNGEIYNYRELRQTLMSKGHKFSTTSDTEVLVHLYEDHGDKFVHYVNGMFALALYDLRQRKLILARDRIGKKPIYYYFDGKCLAFASELKALRHVPGGKFDLDYASLVNFFRYQYIPTPQSIYKQVKKLEPATCLLFQNGHIKFDRYWNFPDENISEASIESDAFREEFLHLLSECVKCRMVADVPLGAFLSGGVDSTAIVYLMSRVAQAPVKTFTIGFDSETYDESASAAEVARTLKTDHSVHMLNQISPSDLPAILSRFGEPFADSSAIPTYYLCKAAREHVTVALSGDGSDEVLGGYNRYIAGTLSKYYFRVPSAFRPTRIEPMVSWLPEGKGYYGSSAIKKAKSLARFMDNLEESGRLPSPRNFTRRELLSLCAFTIDFDSNDPVIARDRMVSHLDYPSRMLWADCRSYLPDDIFVKTDRMSMAHSLEVRSPFVDYRLIEFVSRLPINLKIKGNRTKILLKQTLADAFPQTVLRPKHGFEAPVAQWLAGPLYEPLMDLVHASDNKLIKKDYVLTLIKRHVEKREDHSRRLWPIYVYLIWAKDYQVRKF